MELSSNRSQDEDRVIQRQLYRAGQNNQAAQPSASGASRPSAPAPAKPKPKSRSGSGQPLLTPERRRKVLIGLGVAVWLLLLGGVSYCLFLPDLEGLSREGRAIWQDKNLTLEEKREKMEQFGEKVKNLTPTQRKQMWEMSQKDRARKRNKDSFDFLKLSPEEQVAQLKKEAEEWRKRFEEMRKMRADKGGQKGGNRGGAGGGRPGGGGPPGGGWGGGGGANADRPEGLGQRLDSSSPEARAGGAYKMRLMQQQGLGFGGRGGPGGGKGGGGR